MITVKLLIYQQARWLTKGILTLCMQRSASQNHVTYVATNDHSQKKHEAFYLHFHSYKYLLPPIMNLEQLCCLLKNCCCLGASPFHLKIDNACKINRHQKFCRMASRSIFLASDDTLLLFTAHLATEGIFGLRY